MWQSQRRIHRPLLVSSDRTAGGAVVLVMAPQCPALPRAGVMRWSRALDAPHVWNRCHCHWLRCRHPPRKAPPRWYAAVRRSSKVAAEAAWLVMVSFAFAHRRAPGTRPPRLRHASRAMLAAGAPAAGWLPSLPRGYGQPPGRLAFLARHQQKPEIQLARNWRATGGSMGLLASYHSRCPHHARVIGLGLLFVRARLWYRGSRPCCYYMPESSLVFSTFICFPASHDPACKQSQSIQRNTIS